MNAMKKSPRAATAEKIRAAEAAVIQAKAEHRLAFRKALVALFNEYGLRIDARGEGGIEIAVVDSKFQIGELPE